MSKFETRAIQIEQAPDRNNGAVVPPLYLASTHRQLRVGEHAEGFEYSRVSNPTRAAFEIALANLEEGKHGFSFASGMAAEDAVLRAIVKPGDHILVPKVLYGGTYRLINQVYRAWGVDSSLVDLRDEAALRAAIKPGVTKVIWLETPTNPTLEIFDLAAISNIAHEYGVLVVVDNTFASPYLQRPLTFGVDIVTHSTTKYLGGHSDILGGAVVVNDDALAEAIQFVRFATGAVSAPFDAWLTHRSMKSLAVRMDRHCANALAIAKYLDKHPKVDEVYYPGLESHPQHELAKKQMSDFGGMVSFKLADGAAAEKFCHSTDLFILAESLGGVESLVNHPAGMTHASVAGTELEVHPGVVRLSVGLEHIDDQIADLASALG